jgi:hypothetical protein
VRSLLGGKEEGLEATVDETIRRWTAVWVADAARDGEVAQAVRALQDRALELLLALQDRLDGLAHRLDDLVLTRVEDRRPARLGKARPDSSRWVTSAPALVGCAPALRGSDADGCGLGLHQRG